jgi:hypothetical protein
MTDTATLITQLRVLAQLTRAEAHVARSRVAQASSDDIRDDLRRNAADADARASRIGDLLHELGALPDPVTPLVGRVASLVRGAMEQAQPLDEALLGDLVLEHQLRDRARYVAELAGAADLPAVHELAVDLEAAHTETVEWLTGVLAGLAGGQAALQASPLQRLAAQVTRAANTPARTTPGGAAASVSPTVEQAVGTAIPVDTPVPGRSVPPTPDFADLPAHAAVAALRTLHDPRDVAATLEFEQEHGNRPGVVAAARLRSAALGAS